MNQLESLRAFVSAVEAGSLSAAAKQLAMPLPTLSRKVAELENHLGAELLVRTSRKLIVTEAGQVYVQTARRILEELAAADLAARGELQLPRGELSVAAPIVFGRLHVLPVVAELLREYPDIRVRLVLSDRVANLVDDHLDAAVRIGELADSSLIAQRIGSVRRVTCASPAYLAKRGRPRKPEDLANHDCIGFGADDWLVRPRLTVTTAEAAIDAAIAGLGITRVLSYQLREQPLQRILTSFEPPPLPVHLVHAATQVPRKLRAFLDLAGARLKPILDR
jgi:DNA-binding transcriptional LysR family regulator